MLLGSCLRNHLQIQGHGAWSWCFLLSCIVLDFTFFSFLWPHLWHMDVPRLGVKSELPVYTTAMAMSDLNHIHDLHTKAWGNARSLTHWGRPGIQSASSWRVLSPWSHNGNSQVLAFIFRFEVSIYSKNEKKKKKRYLLEYRANFLFFVSEFGPGKQLLSTQRIFFMVPINIFPIFLLSSDHDSIFFLCVCVCLFAFSWATSSAYGGSQARGPIRAAAASLCQSHSNTGSEPRLPPTPRLTATPTEQGQGWQGLHPQPHGS